MFNTDIHENLIALGYQHKHYEEEYREGGDAESDPRLEGYPAYDEYTSEEDYIVIDRNGCFVHQEMRNLEREAWLAEQEDSLVIAARS